jgi:CBS-domain-containing membrane protein
MHRAEIGTKRRRWSWLLLLAEDEALAADYIKAHARKVEDVMTRNVITATPDTPLNEVARILEKHAIKRVPIVRDGQPVGIVNRANLVQALPRAAASSRSPCRIRRSETNCWRVSPPNVGLTPELLNVTVNDGVVGLWGISDSETERKAIRVAAETIAAVRAVNDHMIVRRMETLV